MPLLESGSAIELESGDGAVLAEFTQIPVGFIEGLAAAGPVAGATGESITEPTRSESGLIE